MQPKAHAHAAEESCSGMESTGKQSRSIRPAPPPPHLRRRRPGTRSAPPSRPSAAPTDGCDEHPCLAGQDRTGEDSSSPSAPLRSRVTGQHVRAGHHSPRLPTNARGEEAARPFSLWNTHSSHSLCLSLSPLDGWMEHSLSLSLFAFACLFIPSPRPSIHPNPSIKSASASLSLSLLQSNQVLGITQRNNSHHHHAISASPGARVAGRVSSSAGACTSSATHSRVGAIPASCHAREGGDKGIDQLPRTCSRPRYRRSRRRAAPARGVRLQARPLAAASSRCCRLSSWAPSGPLAPRKTRPPRRRRPRPPTTELSPRRATTARPRSAGASASSRTSTASATSSPATPRHIARRYLPPPICSCLIIIN